MGIYNKPQLLGFIASKLIEKKININEELYLKKIIT